MILVEHHVGRLLESRYEPPLTIADFEAAAVTRKALTARIGPERITLTDMRKCNVLTPEQADRALQRMTAVTGAPPLRNVILLPPGRATFSLQIQRILREAATPTRRAFEHARDCLPWLDEVLTADEHARAVIFLSRA